MNPSPSCGVEITKGKGTMLGTSTDTSEDSNSGVFIDELKLLLKENKIYNVRIFGVRRHLTGENGNEARIEKLKNYLGK